MSHRIRALTAFNRKLVIQDTSAANGAASAAATEGGGADSAVACGGEDLVVSWKALRSHREYALQALPIPESYGIDPAAIICTDGRLDMP